MTPTRYTADPTQRGLNGKLIDAALKSGRSGGIDMAAMGALGDHLQEIGSPLGAAVSHFVTNRDVRSCYSLSGDTVDALQTPEGHQIIGRIGKDHDGTPILWVSMRTPRYEGRAARMKNRAYEFSIPASAVRMSRTLPRRPLRYAASVSPARGIPGRLERRPVKYAKVETPKMDQKTWEAVKDFYPARR